MICRLYGKEYAERSINKLSFARRIFRKLFSSRHKVIVLDGRQLSENRSKAYVWNKKIDDKAILEIIYSFPMNGQGTIVSGKIKRGFFRVGDKIAIYSPAEREIKVEANIINIKTSLLDVNKINSGVEADFLISSVGADDYIKPGDRGYKVKEEYSNVI